ncbi:MAG TPA: hypothetical protein VJN18_05635 [Polyangiaceae bacterium]|nr:hypothetical protein [Polyangiaceae bacterium]
MTVAQSVAEVLDEHVTLELECIDRCTATFTSPCCKRKVDSAIVKSKREAREFLAKRALLINGRTPEPNSLVQVDWLLQGEVLLQP